MDEALILEQQNKRSLAAAKKSSRNEAAQKAAKELKEKAVKIAKKTTLKVIKSAFAASIVASIVSIIIMTMQVILGNWLGSKIIAKLNLVEFLIWGVSVIITMLAVVAIIALGALIVELIINPGIILDIIF